MKYKIESIEFGKQLRRMCQIAVILFIIGISTVAGKSITSSLILTPDIDGNLRWTDPRLIEPAPLFDAENDVIFLLYTRKNSDTPKIVATDPSLIDPADFGARPIKFLIHGWRNDRSSRFNQLIKDAFLEADDVTVIVVDWSAGASSIDYNWSRYFIIDALRQCSPNCLSPRKFTVSRKLSKFSNKVWRIPH